MVPEALGAPHADSDRLQLPELQPVQRRILTIECQQFVVGTALGDTTTGHHDEAIGQLYHLSSYAERLLVHERAVVKIRDDMPLDRAALIGCGIMTGVGAVFRTAGVRPDARNRRALREPTSSRTWTSMIS